MTSVGREEVGGEEKARRAKVFLLGRGLRQHLPREQARPLPALALSQAIRPLGLAVPWEPTGLLLGPGSVELL